MNVLELFAGIGGMGLGLERAGMTVVGQVEINPFCRSILDKHWPEVPKHDDIKTTIEWWRSQRRPTVDLVAGGYPCQPESLAGLRGGTDDERWLWPDMARVIHAVRPRYVIGENVDGHVTGGLRFVLRDLERLGYTARAGTLRACEVGAPHARARLFVLAHANRVDGQTWLGAGQESGPVPGGDRGTDTWPDPTDWVVATGSRSGRVADGVPAGLDAARVRAVGNAIVPAVAERIGRIIVTADKEYAGAAVR